MSILVTELYTTSISLNAPLSAIMSLINETNLTVISEKVFKIKQSLNFKFWKLAMVVVRKFDKIIIAKHL